MLKESIVERLIPSKTVREMIDTEKLTDTEWVSLVIEQIHEACERNELLDEIAKETDDSRLKDIINKFLQKEKKIYNKFIINNEGRYMYLLWLCEDDDSDLYGVFTDFEDSFRYGRKAEVPFYIEKRPVLGKGKKKVYEDDKLGKKALMDGRHYGDGGEIGYIKYNDKGRLSYCYLQGYTSLDDDIFRSIVDIPNPFDRGDIVTKANEKDFIGIVTTSNSEWMEYVKKCKEHNTENDDSFLYDFSDESIIVDEVSAEGYVNHCHILPIELEYADLDASVAQAELIRAMSRVAKGKSDFQWMMMCYDKLAESRS